MKYNLTKRYKKNRVDKIERNKKRRNRHVVTYYRNRSSIKDSPRAKSPTIMPSSIELFSDIKKQSRDRHTFTAPRVFSLTKNPDETISFIKIVSSCFYYDGNIEITINFDKTTDIDIAAISLLDIIIVEGFEYFKKIGKVARVKGSYPDDFNAKWIFAQTGLPKYIDPTAPISYGEILLNPLDKIEKDSGTETHKIVSYYNRCLQTAGYYLNDKGKAYLQSLINENAIIHSNGESPLYYSTGFYNFGESKGQLSIISLGNSIYDTITSKETDFRFISEMNKLKDIHRNLHYMEYSEDNLLTLYALQDGISSKRSEMEPDRGTGTIKFIEAFMMLGQTTNESIKPKMSIVSGKTHILFDGKYTLTTTENGAKRIAFNKENDLTKKPDPNYVKELEYSFPGVAINIEFYIDGNYLEKLGRKDERKD